jgi:hypothetical protein
MNNFFIVKCFESFPCFNCSKEIKKDSFYMSFEDCNYCPVCANALISIKGLKSEPILNPVKMTSQFMRGVNVD